MANANKPMALSELSIAERVTLVQDIWDSIAAEQGALEVTAAQKEELNRRLAAHRLSPGEGCSWEELKTRCKNER